MCELMTRACSTLKGGGSLVDLRGSEHHIAISHCAAVQDPFANFSLYRLPPGRRARSSLPGVLPLASEHDQPAAAPVGHQSLG